MKIIIDIITGAFILYCFRILIKLLPQKRKKTKKPKLTLSDVIAGTIAFVLAFLISWYNNLLIGLIIGMIFYFILDYFLKKYFKIG